MPRAARFVICILKVKGNLLLDRQTDRVLLKALCVSESEGVCDLYLFLALLLTEYHRKR